MHINVISVHTRFYLWCAIADIRFDTEPKEQTSFRLRSLNTTTVFIETNAGDTYFLFIVLARF